jgi:electron transport complex protein RnfG
MPMTESQRTRDLVIALLIAALAIVGLFGARTLLSDRIDANRQRAAMQPLIQAFPMSQREQITLEMAGTLADSDTLELREPMPFYRVLVNRKLLGWMIPATARQGYNGDIRLITAIDTHGNIIGVQILSQRETPGLGARIERSQTAWIDRFTGRSLHDPSIGAWYVAKDGGKFDELTGATVTSRAVTRSVQRTLIYFREHAATFSEANDGGTERAAHE